MRKIYLEPMPLDDALGLWRERLAQHGLLAPLPGETVPVDEAMGRVTAEPVFARISSPFYHSAAMDGVVDVRVARLFSEMGGLGAKMPAVRNVFLVGAAALAGDGVGAVKVGADGLPAGANRDGSDDASNKRVRRTAGKSEEPREQVPEDGAA